MAGLLLRRRLMVVPALAFAAIAAALFAFEREAEGGVPPWAILAIVGVFLIGVGFLFLVRRDFWERAQRAVLGWGQAWEND
jgi:drug/metabolite transporter (DMT)-like permease